MKTLVVGGGSIGARHLRNLRLLGVDPLGIAEPDSGRRDALSRESSAQGFRTFEEGLAWGPELVVIATPSHLHVSQALAAARRGCHLFVEKPLGHSAEGLAELAREVRKRGLVTLVGCNMRFHPGPARVREIVAGGELGRLLFARLHAGSYLPGWRPGQDYRKSYSASEAMGGGVLLDFIHEIDLARWYFGPVRDVVCVAGRFSALEIATDDVAALICRHEAGGLSEIHLDYVQRTYERGCQVVGAEGSVFWDFRSGLVRLYRAATDRWESWPQPEGWDLNQMYVDELRHLLAAIAAAQPTTLPVGEAIEVVQIALAAAESSRSGRTVFLQEVMA
jgi:predicted dehydrogenase